MEKERPRQAWDAQDYPMAELTEAIIAAGIEVHKALGPGFLEQIYEKALTVELKARGHRVSSQVVVKVEYRGQQVGEHRIDLLVDDEVVVELKSVMALADVHRAQLRSTLKAARKRVGLLMNFNQPILVDGVQRVIN